MAPSALQLYHRWAAAFDHVRALSPVEELTFRIGDSTARVRATTPALRQQLQRPLACPPLPASAPADFTVDLVDLHEAPLPDLPWLPQHSSPEQQTSEYSEGPFVFTRHGDVLLTALDRTSRRTVGLVHAPTRWPLRHYRQAIFITLYQHLRRSGLYLIHASAIARHGRAALLTGVSGAGKTTTMLTCVAAGFQFLGDDSTLVRAAPDGGVDVVALLNTLDVTDQTAAWFPELAPHLSPQRSHTGKRQVILSEAFPTCIADQGRLGVILAPEVTNQEQTRLAPISKAALLGELLFYSVDLHDPALARQHLDFLAETLEHIPCYRLLLGHNRQQIPAVLEEVLQGLP